MADQSLQQVNKQTLSTTTALQVAFSSSLEMNREEIRDRIDKEVEENPALEKVDETDSESDFSSERNDSDDDNSHESDNNENEIPEYDSYSDNDDDVEYQGTHNNSNNYSGSDSERTFVFADNDTTLADYLQSQLAEFDLSDRQQLIAQTVIGNIDDDGYLTRSIAAMANDIYVQSGETVTDDEVRFVFNIIRQMDPPGVCAINLNDCLILQLQRLNSAEQDIVDAIELMQIVDDLSAVGQLKEATRLLNLNRARFENAMRRIRSLSPKPGSAIGHDSASIHSQQISPDFDVTIDQNDVITVTLLNDVPELQISQSFTESIENKVKVTSDSQRQQRQWIGEQRNKAQLFIRVIEMRQKTLFRVMSAIVALQRDFFLSGDERDIHPMIIDDIQKITGDDTSVISRATNRKYVQTPYGIFSLKHFFNERINDDDDTSSHEIIAVIKEIIESEPPEKPYSDQKITEMLNSRGYNIARRTVFKYRENHLHLPSSSKRKRLKQ